MKQDKLYKENENEQVKMMKGGKKKLCEKKKL